MPALPNMSLILPTDHGSPGIWDTILDATFALIDEHDHTTGKGVPIPAAALDIDADVPWNSGGDYFAITGIKALDFQPVSTALVASYAGALFVSSADNNLYYRTTGGTNVKIIDGTSLNVSAFAGGIGGDYSAVGALLDYDDATDTYRMRQESSAGVRQYAKLGVADILLREYDPAGDATVPTNAITVKSPDALAAPYDFILPAAVPGTQALLQMSTAGVLSATNTIAQSITATDFRFTSSQTFPIPAMEAVEPGAATHTKTAAVSGAQKAWTLVASTNRVAFPIRVPTGCIITGWAVYIEKNTSNVNTITARMHSTRSNALGTETNHGTSAITNNANAPGFISLASSAVDANLNVTVTQGFEYYVVFTPGGGVAPTNDILYSCEVFVTRP